MANAKNKKETTITKKVRTLLKDLRTISTLYRNRKAPKWIKTERAMLYKLLKAQK